MNYCMIIKGITLTHLVNIELNQYSFKVLSAVSLESELGKKIVGSKGLEWLYNNRHCGNTPLQCLLDYYLSNKISEMELETITENNLGIYEKSNILQSLSLSDNLAIINKYKCPIFDKPKILGLWRSDAQYSFAGTDLIEIEISNEYAKLIDVKRKFVFTSAGETSKRFRAAHSQYINRENGTYHLGGNMLVELNNVYSKFVFDSLNKERKY
jgi:hypothetical protein